MHAIIRKTVTAASLIALAGHGLANGIEAAPELERVPKAATRTGPLWRRPPTRSGWPTTKRGDS